MRFSAGSRFVFVFALTLALAGCATIDSAERAITGKQSETFYSASAGLPVRNAAFVTSKVISRLALHEKVTRTEVDRGFAHIVTEKGVDGWVDNAQLLWRLPSAAPATPDSKQSPKAVHEEPIAPSEPATAEPAPVVKPEPEPDPAPAATQAAEPAPAPAAEPDPPPAPKKKPPATYDPF